MRCTRLLSIFFVCFAFSRPGVCQTTPDAEQFKGIEIHTTRMIDAIKIVAQTYRTVIGFESVHSTSPVGPISIKLEHATLKQALDAITNSDPRYSWQSAASGNVIVYLRDARLSLLEVEIGPIAIDNLKRQDIVSLLGDRPEVTRWLSGNACYFQDVILSSRLSAEDTRRISLINSGKTLRSVLDEVTKLSGTYFWAVLQSDIEGKCYIGISLPAADIPRVPKKHE